MKELGDANLKQIAIELTEKLRKSTTVDWQHRDSVRAKLRNLIRRLLRKYKYPPDEAPEAIKLVMKQAEALADKVVFVGMTSTGLGDDQPTPVSALDRPVPGVEVHANIYSALVDDRLKTRINPHLNILVALFLFPLM